MKHFVSILLILIISCTSEADSAKGFFEKHENEFEKIVDLLKADKLRKVYGRGGYEIPDSFKLKATFGSIVFRETDFTYDSSYSILFRIGFDTSQLLRSYPTIVYTDNNKRLAEYNTIQAQAFKFKENWYFLSRQ